MHFCAEFRGTTTVQVLVWPGAVIGPAVPQVNKAVTANYESDVDDAILTPGGVCNVEGTATV